MQVCLQGGHHVFLILDWHHSWYEKDARPNGVKALICDEQNKIKTGRITKLASASSWHFDRKKQRKNYINHRFSFVDRKMRLNSTHQTSHISRISQTPLSSLFQVAPMHFVPGPEWMDCKALRTLTFSSSKASVWLLRSLLTFSICACWATETLEQPRRKKQEQLVQATCAAADPGPVFLFGGELLLLSQLSHRGSVSGSNAGHFLRGLFRPLVIVGDFPEHVLRLLAHLLHCGFA